VTSQNGGNFWRAWQPRGPHLGFHQPFPLAPALLMWLALAAAKWLKTHASISSTSGWVTAFHFPLPRLTMAFVSGHPRAKSWGNTHEGLAPPWESPAVGITCTAAVPCKNGWGTASTPAMPLFMPTAGSRTCGAVGTAENMLRIMVSWVSTLTRTTACSALGISRDQVLG